MSEVEKVVLFRIREWAKTPVLLTPLVAETNRCLTEERPELSEEIFEKSKRRKDPSPTP